MKKVITIILLFIVFIQACKPKINSLDDILLEHQWRKTEEAIYNTNNEFEEYTFLFDDVEDCEKNSYRLFSSSLQIVDLCKNKVIWIEWEIKNDSFYLYPYTTDIIQIFHSKKHINYYDEKKYILDYDTTINDVSKKIKETFTAFPKRK